MHFLLFPSHLFTCQIQNWKHIKHHNVGIQREKNIVYNILFKTTFYLIPVGIFVVDQLFIINYFLPAEMPDKEDLFNLQICI